MFKTNPLLSRTLAFVVTPLLLAALLGYVHSRKSLPADEGTVKSAVSQNVDIQRDSHGVVYITAKADRDAFFALGYAHAQDRLWQLELERRIAQGRLSEILGKDTLDEDIWMRTLGLYPSAEQAWARLNPAAQTSLTAYAAGINAWIRQNPVLPPEFIALGIKPEPWRPVDSLAWSKVFALNLAGNMWNEISNVTASHYLSKQQMIDLLGHDVDGNEKSLSMTSKHLSDLWVLKGDLESKLQLGGRFVGSNAWVVAGKYMANGKAALANDPHLGLQIPSLWYAAHLKGDKLDVSGMSLVGLPVIIFGENRKIAWGGTSMMADAQDLYLEQLNPQNPNQYMHDGQWQNFKVRTEIINIKADFPAWLRSPVEPAKIQVRETLNGPVISDAIGAFEQPVALKWTALATDDTSYESFLRVDYAQNWDEFKEAFRPFVAPAMNILYADTSNNIGSIGIGKIPVRLNGQARIPVPGWNDDYAWTGYIPYEGMPQRFNPPSGYIVSANNKPVDDSYAYFISNNWAPPARAQRIDQLIRTGISKGKGITLDDFKEMQADTLDLSSIRLLAYLKTFPAEGADQQRALKYLMSWNGDMSRDSQGAAVFFVWARHLRENLFTANLQKLWNKSWEFKQLDAIVANTSYDQITDALTRPRSAWCAASDGVAYAAACMGVLRKSLDQAIAELEKLRGSNAEHWRWGDIHQTLYAHMPFSNVSSIAPLFERKISNSGSVNTINVANATHKEAGDYEQTFGAGFRQIMQGDSDGGIQHLLMNSTGQSGNILSPHYSDMVNPFRDVEYLEMNDKQFARDSHRITLIPE